MKPDTAEWIAKAEADFRSARREFRARPLPNYDLVCFLCQQSSEKYLKARLCEATINFPKTHDLVTLLNLLLPIHPLWQGLQNHLSDLTDYAVDYRYPGVSANRQRARKALVHCTHVRRTIRDAMGLPLSKKRVPRKSSKARPKRSRTRARRPK